MRLLRRVLIPVVAVASLAGACGGDDEEGSSDGTPNGGSNGGGSASGQIVVGSKLDTEAKLLGEMMAQVLEAKGYSVSRKIPTGPTDITRQALTGKQIDAYWEFTGTGLSLLGQTAIGEPAAAYSKVKELDAANGVTWLPAAAMNDTYALAVKGEGGPVTAPSLTELAAYLKTQPSTRLCADPEGGFRADVLPQLKTAYGIEFSDVRQLDNALIPPAVAANQCQVGVVYSTAALIVKSKLRTLTDDKVAFGAYTPAPTLLTERLARWPTLAADLAGLTAALDTPSITKLNAAVDLDGREVADVAKEFLTQHSLLG